MCNPVCPTAAFEAGAIQDPLDMYLQDIFTIGVNLAGVPAISIPSGFSSQKLPFGLQIMGPKRADTLVCRFAAAFEKATPFNQESPHSLSKDVMDHSLFALGNGDRP